MWICRRSTGVSQTALLRTEDVGDDEAGGRGEPDGGERPAERQLLLQNQRRHLREGHVLVQPPALLELGAQAEAPPLQQLLLWWWSWWWW